MDTRGGNTVGARLYNGMTEGGDLPMPFDRCLEDLPLELAFIVGDPLSSGSFTHPPNPARCYPPRSSILLSTSSRGPCYKRVSPSHCPLYISPGLSGHRGVLLSGLPSHIPSSFSLIIYVNGHVLILFLLCFVNTTPCHHARNYCCYPSHHLCSHRPQTRPSLSTLRIPV